MSELRSTLEQQGAAINVLINSDKDMKAALEDNNRSKELMQMDKSYLQQELRNALAVAEERSRTAEKFESLNIALDIKVSLII